MDPAVHIRVVFSVCQSLGAAEQTDLFGSQLGWAGICSADLQVNGSHNSEFALQC